MQTQAQRTLRETIASVHVGFSQLRSELTDAHRQIAELREELNRKGPGVEGIQHLDLSSLRRRVAFYCHPDRGGDQSLMQTLNSLFDALETTRSAHTANG